MLYVIIFYELPDMNWHLIGVATSPEKAQELAREHAWWEPEFYSHEGILKAVSPDENDVALLIPVVPNQLASYIL